MISRRKIISRSLDNLDQIGGIQNEEEEDVWHDKEKLFRDHIKEVLSKWEQIDDEIWAKIIVFEKNRRVAKAYARSSVISINGSKNGFDGVRIGLNGFENPMRDSATKVVKKVIGDGFKIKMDEVGNILIKRYGKNNVYAHNTAMSTEETVIGSDILQAPHMTIPHGTSSKLFDMRKYTANITREFSQTYPESFRLERQCLSAVSLVKSSNNLITSPLWILIINVVAMDMLRNQLQSISKPIGANSEDPYSTIESQVGLIYPSPVASDESTNSNNSNKSYSIKSRKNLYNGGFLEENPYVPKPDYDIYNQRMPILPEKKTTAVQRKKQDDPYYCGLLARIPNFIRSSKTSKQCKKEAKMFRKISASQQVLYPQPTHPLPIAAFHSQYPPQTYFPYNQPHPGYRQLSHSQLSLWDARSLISAHE